MSQSAPNLRARPGFVQVRQNKARSLTLETRLMITVHLIAAARPNFMKIAPLYHALGSTDWARPMVVHTGQHYDRNMSDAILEDLKVPAPAYHLGVGSGSHAEQTGGVMIAYEKVCQQDRPDWIVVVGDVNSTAACAIVGAKLWIPVVASRTMLMPRLRNQAPKMISASPSR